MKRFLYGFFSVFIVIVLTAFYFGSNTSETGKPTLQLKDVKSLQVVGGLPGAHGSPLYQTTDEAGQTIIANVIGWIHSSRSVPGQTEYGKHGYPMEINLKMNDGTTIVVEPAYHCVSQTNADGSGSKTCTPDPGEMVLTHDSGKIRFASAELYNWLKEGWKKDKGD